MPRGRSELFAHRVRDSLVALGVRVPALVRGQSWSTALSRELARRLARGVSLDAWQRVLASDNPSALRAASTAAAGLSPGIPAVTEALRRRAAQRPDDVALRLDLCAALRQVGQRERAAQSLVGVTGLRAQGVRPLLREALALGDAEYVADVLRAASPRDSAASTMLAGAATATDVLGGYGDSTAAVDAVAVVAGDHRRDVAVLAALVTWACHLGLPAMRRLAAALPGSAADASSLAYLATRMRASGDLSASTELAEAVLERQPTDLAMRRLVMLGRSSLTTLEAGWQPPASSAHAIEVAPARIDYLLHSSLPDTSLGYAIRTQGLLAALRQQGWDVHGVTQPGYPDARDVPDRESVDGVPYLRLQAGRPLPHWPVEEMVADYVHRLEPLLSAERPGILHAASNFRNGLAAVAAARRAGLPVVYEVRGLWQYTRAVREPGYADTEMFALLDRLEVDAAKSADRVIVITEALGRYLVERGVPADRIVVVPNGVDTTRFMPRERDQELAADLGLGERVVIGYVGGLVEYEGLELLIDAVNEVVAEYQDLAVLIVGDGRSLPTLRARVRDLGLERVVTFTGRVPHADVERYYSLVDIAPFPRLPVEVAELVSPLKPLEAMAMGKSVVASDVAALGEIVDDGHTGLLFAKGSATALADALRRLLDEPDLRERNALAGLDWVRRERSWPRLASTVSGIWTQLWSDHYGAPPPGVAADHASSRQQEQA